MFARVSMFEGPPESVDDTTSVRESVLPAARRMEGFAGLLMLGDRASGRSLAITFWHTEAALKAGEEAATALRVRSAGEAGQRIVAVERYEVLLDEKGA